MLYWITVLLLCQWLGELAATASGLPVPGPVIGMILLLAFLLWRGEEPPDLARVADGLLDHLALLFVPAGVGVVAHLALLRAQWPPIAAALLVSTMATVLVTGWVMQRLMRKRH